MPAYIILASLGAIVAAMALPWPGAARDSRPESGDRDGFVRVLSGCLLLLVPALLAAAAWAQEPFGRYHLFTKAGSTWAALLWLAGLVAGLVYSLWPGPAHVPRSRTARGPFVPASRLELPALAAIVLVATALRTWQLGAVPGGINFDEADSALDTLQLFHLPFQALGPHNWGHNPSLYFYAMALLFAAAGHSIAVARLTSAIFGVLGVLGVYIVGRRAGGPAVGLCAAALLAVSPWSVHFSRFAIMDIAAPTIVSLGLAALVAALAQPRGRWFALSGVLLGLSVLTYAGAALSAVGVAACVLAVRAFTDPHYRRAAWPAVLLLPAALIAAATPMLAALRLDPSYVLWREHQVSLLAIVPSWSARIAALGDNLRAHLLMFTVAGDRSGANNLPGQPMLDSVSGACFLLGLGICLRHLRHPFALLLLVWLASCIVPGILSDPAEAPEAARTVGAVAPIALIAALPLALLGRAIYALLAGGGEASATDGRTAGLRSPEPGASARPGDDAPPDDRGPDSGVAGRMGGSRRAAPDRAAAIAGCVVALPLAVALSQTTQLYFGVYAHNFVSWQAMRGALTQVGRALPPYMRQGYAVRVDAEAASLAPVLQYTAGVTPQAYDRAAPMSPEAARRGVVFAVPENDRGMLASLRSRYPAARVIALAPTFDPLAVQYRLVVVSPRAIPASAGGEP